MDCCKYLGSQVPVDGECENDVVQRMNEEYKVWGEEALQKNLMSNILRIKATKFLYERVIVPMALYVQIQRV